MTHIVHILLFCLSLGIGLAPAAGEGTHPFSIHDMLAMDRLSEASLSPDGEWIVYTLRTTDLEANRGRTDLWLVRSDGTDSSRLTSHEAADFNPCWSSCGKHVWFLSTRSGSSQVWIIRVDGGEARQITDLPLDVDGLIASPYGSYLALAMEVFPGMSVEETKAELEEIENSKVSGRIYDRLFIRHWDTWKDGRRSHVFVMPVKGGDPVDVMKEMDADSPSKPFGGMEEVAFAPDNAGLVFTARDAGRGEPWSTDFDLYVAPVDASEAPRCLTEQNEAWDTTPVFSPDGKTLAYLAMAKPGYEADRFRIVLMDWPGGGTRILTEAWDRSPGGFSWSEDGSTIYADAANLGQVSLFGIDGSTGQARTVVRDGSLGIVGEANRRLFYTMHCLQSPREIFSVKPNGKDIRSVTRINAERVAAARMGDYEQFRFPGWNDEEVYGMMVEPVDFDPSKAYPVAFLIHGGPQGSFGNEFHYRWNPQAYAGAGYACVMIDFHGSVGYGQAFSDAIRGDWGGKPLVDLQKGLAAALERYPWMDADRIGALGASYGGYMINWIAGNWPDRFRCLICHDGNLDERLAYFDTEELWFPEWDHMGKPWTHPENYEKHNPIHFVRNWKTPMLVIHGAKDFRVVETQGMSTFTALQRLGIPSRFVYFPDENHWVLKPHNSIFWHDTVIDWLDRWCKE